MASREEKQQAVASSRLLPTLGSTKLKGCQGNLGVPARQWQAVGIFPHGAIS